MAVQVVVVVVVVEGKAIRVVGLKIFISIPPRLIFLADENERSGPHA